MTEPATAPIINTTPTEDALIDQLAQYSTTAQRGGWNVQVRDVPARPHLRRMEAVRSTVWIRLEVNTRNARWSLHARLTQTGARTYRVPHPAHVRRMLQGIPLETSMFRSCRTQLADRELPLHLR